MFIDFKIVYFDSLARMAHVFFSIFTHKKIFHSFSSDSQVFIGILFRQKIHKNFSLCKYLNCLEFLALLQCSYSIKCENNIKKVFGIFPKSCHHQFIQLIHNFLPLHPSWIYKFYILTLSTIVIRCHKTFTHS